MEDKKLFMQVKLPNLTISVVDMDLTKPFKALEIMDKPFKALEIMDKPYTILEIYIIPRYKDKNSGINKMYFEFNTNENKIKSNLMCAKYMVVFSTSKFQKYIENEKSANIIYFNDRAINISIYDLASHLESMENNEVEFLDKQSILKDSANYCFEYALKYEE